MPCVTMSQADYRIWQGNASAGKGSGKGLGKQNGQVKGAKKGKGAGKNGSQAQGKGPGHGGKTSTENGGGKPEPFWCLPCGGYKNFGFRTHCNMCNRTRAKAILEAPSKGGGPPKPRAEETVEDADGWITGGLTNKERKKAKWQLQIQAKRLGVTLMDPQEAERQANAATMEGPKSTRYAPTPPETIGEPPKVNIHAFGLTTLPTMKEPKKAFVFPAELKWDESAEEIVAIHTFCANATKMADAKEREADYIQLLQRLAARAKKDPAHEASTRKLLAEVKAELTNLTGKGSANGGKAAIEGMKSKLQAVTFAESTRVQDAVADREKMEAKVTSMGKEFTAQIEELQRRHEVFKDCVKEVGLAWINDEAARVQRFQQTCDAWNAFIKEAEESLPAVGAAPTEAPAKPEVVEIPPEDVEEGMTEEEEQVMKKQETDYALWAPWSPQDLPAVEKPKDDEARYWVHLGAHVMNWSEQHACAPCSYQQLIGPGDPTTLMESLVTLIGSKYWTTIYGDRVVLASDIVPRHVGFVLYCALQKPYTAAQKELGKEATDTAKEMAKTENIKAVKEMKLQQEKRQKKQGNRKDVKGTLGGLGK